MRYSHNSIAGFLLTLGLVLFSPSTWGQVDVGFARSIASLRSTNPDTTASPFADVFVHQNGPAYPGHSPRVPFPLDHEIRNFPWTDLFGPADGFGEEKGMWAYANETGRVRASVHTGLRDPISDQPSSFGRVDLFWGRVFVHDSGQNPTFTVNPSRLIVLAATEGDRQLINYDDAVLRSTGKNVPHSDPYAKFSFVVKVWRKTESNDLELVGETFRHEAKVSGIGRTRPVSNFQSIGASGFTLKRYTFSQQGELVPDSFGQPQFSHPPTDNLELQLISERAFCPDLPAIGGFPVCYERILGARYDLPSFTEEIDLSTFGIQQGDKYSITYDIVVEGGEDGSDNHYAEGFFGDPLDIGPGGLTLTTADSPASLGSPRPEECRAAQDPNRYVAYTDGTAADRYTGLIWQRCALGTELDDGGTPNDLADDQCTDVSSGTFDWQSALTDAAANTFAGFDDWRVPNVKALDSIVNDCQAPTGDSAIFPNTASGNFWTSTPDTEGTSAWQVEFADGGVVTGEKTVPALVRLVRDGVEPEAPLPRLNIRNAAISEGNSGTSSIDFKVSLTHAAATDVSFDYTTEALTADENNDFVPTAGTVTIPAGLTEVEIGVQVTGDIQPERPERFAVRLSNASSNVWLATPSAIGTIEDDEPGIYVHLSSLEAAEGNTTGNTIDVTVRLTHSSSENISVGYTTIDETAFAGADYSSVAGTLVFSPGEISAELTIPLIGDDVFENDEVLLFELSAPMGAYVNSHPASIRIIDDDGPGTYAALNDTAITHCANTVTTLLACPQADHPGQDGELGRDVEFPDDADGYAGFSFTRVAEDGTLLDAGANQWACIQDEVTGLVWERKERDATHLRSRDWTYSWNNNSGINDGGDPGSENGGICFAQANCDTEKYAAEVNASNLCGYGDWRLPTPEEAFSIAAVGTSQGPISRGLDAIFFPNAFVGNGSGIWTSASHGNSGDQAWLVNFATLESTISHVSKSATARIRLVRGGITR